MHDMREPNYEKAIHRVADSIDGLTRQWEITNLLTLAGMSNANFDTQVAALKQAKQMLRIKDR